MSIIMELNEFLDPQRYRLGTRLIDVQLLRKVIRHIEKQQLIIEQMREAVEIAMSKSCSNCSGEMNIARKLWEDMEIYNEECNPTGSD